MSSVMIISVEPLFLLIAIILTYTNGVSTNRIDSVIYAPTETYCERMCNKGSAAVASSSLSSSNSSLMNDALDIIILAMKPRNYSYINEGVFWGTPLLLRLLSNSSAKSIRIHIFSDNDDILIDARAYGFIGHDLKITANVIDKDFSKYYVHNSFNLYEYEFACFNRWHVFDHMIKTWNNQPNHPQKISKILTIDSDVVIMVDPIQLFNNLVSMTFQSTSRIANFEVVVASPGAIQLWSAKGLSKFSSFINDWYSDSKANILEKNQRFGKYIFNQTTSKYFVFSDMEIMAAFLSKAPETRSACFALVAHVAPAHRSPWQSCIISALKCIPVGKYGVVLGSNHIKDPHVPLRWDNHTKGFIVANEQHPLCFLHFQGDRAKGYIKYYLRYFLIQYGYDWKLMTDSGPFLIQMRDGPSIYLVNERGTRRKIPEFDTFVGLNYDLDMVYDRLPPEFGRAIPEGDPLLTQEQELLYVPPKIIRKATYEDIKAKKKAKTKDFFKYNLEKAKKRSSYRNEKLIGSMGKDPNRLFASTGKFKF